MVFLDHVQDLFAVSIPTMVVNLQKTARGTKEPRFTTMPLTVLSSRSSCDSKRSTGGNSKNLLKGKQLKKQRLSVNMSSNCFFNSNKQNWRLQRWQPMRALLNKPFGTLSTNMIQIF